MKERVQEQRNKLEYLSSCIKDIQNSRMAVNHCLFLIRILDSGVMILLERVCDKLQC